MHAQWRRSCETPRVAKITGIGGIFLKTDPEATRHWLRDNLGLASEPWGAMFPWAERGAPDQKGYTVLGLHERSSTYFGPSKRDFMINFRVDDLDGMLAHLRRREIEIVKVFDPEPNGRFAHVRGPDGLVIELWEPKADDPYDP
jgi:catechol 2,3-dioxygenase-like lactoylglutathione lyase family enzyme